MKEYKIIEKQKDEQEKKYYQQLDTNDELMKEIMNMEQVITDQDEQIKNMRKKLNSKLQDQRRNQTIDRNMELMKLRLVPGYNNVTQSELEMSANISRRINLQNFKGGREKINLIEDINEDAITDVLNLSYQVLNSGTKGMNPSPLLARSRNGKNSGSTTEDDSHYKSNGNRVFN